MKEIDNASLLESLEETFFTYFLHMKNHEYSEMLDFMAPIVFEVIPKELLIRNMESMNAEEEEDGVELLDCWIADISPIYQVGGHYYAALLYGFTLRVPVEGNEADGLMDELGQQIFEGNIESGPGGLTQEIVFERALYALRAVKAEDWKFLENKPQAVQLVRMTVPTEAYKVLEKWLETHEEASDDDE